LRKIGYIFYIIFLCASCSVTRRHMSKAEPVNKAGKDGVIYQNILSQNLTSGSFFIEKAEFKIKSNEGEKSVLGTIKYIKPDKFLVSLKSNTGIEIVRIYFTGDSIMANDKFNKKLYYGSTSFLKEKYGFTTEILPVILGDYINDNIADSSKVNCTDGKLRIDGLVKNVHITYIIDCQYGKIIVAFPEGKGNSGGLKIKYSNFFKSNRINIPGNIEINDGQGDTIIEITILKIIFPWEGTIEFIPGRQYEKIHLQ
jgi:hypothetical protein